MAKFKTTLSGKIGKWITVQGRRIFIRAKKAKAKRPLNTRLNAKRKAISDLGLKTNREVLGKRKVK